MRRFLLLICAMIPMVCIAQNRIVRGVVYDSNSRPLANAIIKAVNSSETVSSTENGIFEIALPTHISSVFILMEGYITEQVEIDGSYIIARLNINKLYWENKAKEEEAARIAAEKKAKAEEDARIAEQKRVEAERLAAERAEAARIKAEEDARIAEQKRVEAERITAEKNAEKARKEEAKRAATEKRRQLYAVKQKGFGSVIDVSAMIDMYNYFTSVGLSYTAGYKFNNKIYLGAGFGINYNFEGAPKSFELNDRATQLTPYKVSAPVYLYLRTNFVDRRCSPFFALATGVNFGPKQTLHLPLLDVKYSTSGPFVTPQLGLNFRTSTKTSLYFAVGLKCVAIPKCIDYTSYNATFRPSLGYGVDMHLGFTF